MSTAPPTLTDNRVESMRSTVMYAVDADITRRGTRTRRAVGLAAASVLVVGFGSVGFNALGPTGNSDSAATADSRSIDTSAGKALEGPAQEGPAGGVKDQAAPDSSIVPDADREVITTGTVNVTVKEPRDTAQRLSAWVDSVGGRVDVRSENGSGDDASAFLQIRVPSTKVTATIARLKTYGTVNTLSLQNDDVTTQTKDLDARIRALEISVARLEKLLSEATSSTALVAAESALTQRQEQLESLQSQRTSIADQVSLSTLTIELSQKTRADTVSPGGFRGGLVDGWNALVSTVNRIVEVVGVMLPWTAIAVVLYGAYRLVSRRRRGTPTASE